LVFLTGQEEIETFLILFRDLCQKGGYVLRPLHAKLPLDKQVAALQKTRDGSRKVIVATNIAESSVTVDGVVYVIDCGYFKVKYFDFLKDADALLTIPASKANIHQRAGRAGRTRRNPLLRSRRELPSVHKGPI
jgi:HrpA-like RNA helicase